MQPSRSLPTVTTAALVLAALPAWGASHLKQDLVPTGKVPAASGRVKLVVRGSDGRLGVSGRHLGQSASFEVVVDGVRIGALTTNGGGSGKARFNTRPRGRDQLLGVDPRGKLIEVRDEDGDDVLDGEMGDDQEPGAIRCCVADEDETECEAETPEECDAAHGTNLGAGSCMPNPCPTTSPEQVRCCLSDHDEDGPECEQTTAAECSEEHGVSIGPGTCDATACGPTPPPEEAIRCCITEQEDHAEEGDDGEEGGEAPECERVTPDACAALHGTNLGPGSCEPNPCVASPSGAFLDHGTALP